MILQFWICVLEIASVVGVWFVTLETDITVRYYFPDTQMIVLTPLSRVCSGYPISSNGHGQR